MSEQRSAVRGPREIVQEFFDAQASGDDQAVIGLFAPDATWDIPGDPAVVPWVGSRNREGIGDYLTLQRDNSEPTGFELYTWLVDGPDVVVLGRFAYRFASGGSIDDPFAVHLVVRDGLIRSFRIFEDSLSLARGYTGTAVVSAS